MNLVQIGLCFNFWFRNFQKLLLLTKPSEAPGAVARPDMASQSSGTDNWHSHLQCPIQLSVQWTPGLHSAVLSRFSHCCQWLSTLHSTLLCVHLAWTWQNPNTSCAFKSGPALVFKASETFWLHLLPSPVLQPSRSGVSHWLYSGLCTPFFCCCCFFWSKLSSNMMSLKCQ